MGRLCSLGINDDSSGTDDLNVAGHVDSYTDRHPAGLHVRDRGHIHADALSAKEPHNSVDVVRELPVSTGRPTSVTLTRAWTGTVGQDLGNGGVDGGMYADFKWFLFQDLYGSVLIHSVPYTRQGEDKAYDPLDALGIRPASRGCVRISPEDAEWLKTWDPVGVPIEITAWPGTVEQVAGTLQPIVLPSLARWQQAGYGGGGLGDPLPTRRTYFLGTALAEGPAQMTVYLRREPTKLTASYAAQVAERLGLRGKVYQPIRLVAAANLVSPWLLPRTPSRQIVLPTWGTAPYSLYGDSAGTANREKPLGFMCRRCGALT